MYEALNIPELFEPPIITHTKYRELLPIFTYVPGNMLRPLSNTLYYFGMYELIRDFDNFYQSFDADTEDLEDLFMTRRKFNEILGLWNACFKTIFILLIGILPGGGLDSPADKIEIIVEIIRSLISLVKRPDLGDVSPVEVLGPNTNIPATGRHIQKCVPVCFTKYFLYSDACPNNLTAIGINTNIIVRELVSNLIYNTIRGLPTHEYVRNETYEDTERPFVLRNVKPKTKHLVYRSNDPNIELRISRSWLNAVSFIIIGPNILKNYN